ncbi:MAG: GDP-mannose 4,6-dehydratase [Candidatus Caldarchaeum sp.]|nr:GDP-mannose 4,6-dehydratase [Candidatus Caldarchaeum sp.]MCS7136883.1 GDP-mannose 4,6-dehydratase [Candidatus Caldarchaeum sp.]MDW7977877.1 GDP-mannose 4,6-dehydratase [Candidatus Caldarchaeum sp.]MDW8360490.1 GDP-mannose 4,6-dehydratase [Candidatus Caldarchaeum sp.]
MSIVVTGGAGFIGSHVAEYFLKNEEDVIVVDNLSRAALLKKGHEWRDYNIRYLKNNYPKMRFLEADVREINEHTQAIGEAGLVIHAAAQVAVTTSVEDPLTDFMVNVYGTLSALEFARKKDSAFIFFSTNKVYGENVNKIPVKDVGTRYVFADRAFEKGIPESFPVDGCSHTPYGCSKLAADIYVQDYAETYGLPTAVLRLSCIYGERQFGVEDQGWLAHFVMKHLRNSTITIYGDGKQVRDVLHVDDLVRAVDLTVRNLERIRGQVFNIGGGIENAVSLLEALDYLGQLSGRQPSLQFTDWRPADQKVYVSDYRKAEQTLGWRPQVGWRSGVKRLYDWIRENTAYQT